MAKQFAPRVSKRKRKTIDLASKLDRDLFAASDEKLLKGAKLAEIELKDIVVKEQVRTKFNDASLKELGENIKTNGLIQPLVLHLIKGHYTLICGERRFRAMSLLKMKKCPCFVLENKSAQELMAIQFSENSAREALHYIDKADGILNYQKATKASERKIVAALGISKSEVHRSLIIAKLPVDIKEAAKNFDIEKYVLVEFDAIDTGALKRKVASHIKKGDIRKRSELKKAMSGSVLKAGRKGKKASASIPKGMTANAFIKAMNSKSNELKLDRKTKQALKLLVEETKDLMED